MTMIFARGEISTAFGKMAGGLLSFRLRLFFGIANVNDFQHFLLNQVEQE
jgi:hypothetical protein